MGRYLDLTTALGEFAEKTYNLLPGSAKVELDSETGSLYISGKTQEGDFEAVENT